MIEMMMFGLFRKRVNPKALLMAGQMASKRLSDNLQLYCNLAELTMEEVSEAINASVETQMFALSISTTLLNYAVQDAYYELRLSGPLTPMPEFEMTNDEMRRALRAAWSCFGASTVRANIDMRYRYIYVQKLKSAAEADLWTKMEAWSKRELDRAFYTKSEIDTDWLSFCVALKNGNLDLARSYIS